MMRSKATFFVGFACSFLFFAMSGIDLAFNTYALELKETFNLTQTQVEIIGSMGTIGMCLGSMEPVVSAYLGSTVSCWFVLVTFPVSSGMFAVAARYKDIFSMWPGLICLFQLFMSTSNCAGFLTISQICIENVPSKHKMKIVTLTHACACLGKVILGLLITATMGDLFKFFGIISFAVCGISLASFGLLMPFGGDQTETNEKNRDEITLLQEPYEQKDERQSSVKYMFTSPFFHAIFWPVSIYYSCGYSVLNNITVLAKSIGDPNPINSIYIISAGIITFRIITGALLDHLNSLIFDSIWLSVSVFLFSIGLVLGMFYLQSSTLFIFDVLVSFCMSTTFAICASLIFREFGRKHYSIITALFFLICGVCQVILQLVIGLLYDHVVLSEGYAGNECFGRECFFWSLCMMLVITVMTMFITGFTAVWYALKGNSNPKVNCNHT